MKASARGSKVYPEINEARYPWKTGMIMRNQSVQIVAKTSAFSVGLNGMLVIGAMRLNEQEMNDVLFRQLAKDKKWPSCPSCGRCVELDGGCAVMTCSYRQ
ncbi:hypothetical protein D5086_033686 [Populus alba]|uniref:Uncharacterized protein n=1 Tax=Populus alba TaxID=43335 RepID=A0ACC4AHK2_POPAL